MGQVKAKASCPKAKTKARNAFGIPYVMPNAADPARASINDVYSSGPQGDPESPVKTAMLEVEQKMEEGLVLMRQEAATTPQLMQQNIKNMRDDFKEQTLQHQKDIKAVAQEWMALQPA